MKPKEIKSFLAKNTDFVIQNSNTIGGIADYINVDDLPELFRRLFESAEYKSFVERERQQQAEALLAKTWVNTTEVVWFRPVELNKSEFVDKRSITVDCDLLF